jgi:hypothetical protein
MKVKDLIENLKIYDENLDVVGRWRTDPVLIVWLARLTQWPKTYSSALQALLSCLS